MEMIDREADGSDSLEVSESHITSRSIVIDYESGERGQSTERRSLKTYGLSASIVLVLDGAPSGPSCVPRPLTVPRASCCYTLLPEAQALV